MHIISFHVPCFVCAESIDEFSQIGQKLAVIVLISFKSLIRCGEADESDFSPSKRDFILHS